MLFTKCALPHHRNAKQIQTFEIALLSPPIHSLIFHIHCICSYNNIHSQSILVEVLSVRTIGNLLCVDAGASSGQVWFMTSLRDLSCQSSFSVLASSVTGGLTGQSSLTFFSAKVAGAKILALGLYSGASMIVSAWNEIIVRIVDNYTDVVNSEFISHIEWSLQDKQPHPLSLSPL